EQIINMPTRSYKNAAVSIDVRNLSTDLEQFPEVLDELKGTGLACEIFFLDADEKILLKRFSETRRKHPLTNQGLPLAEALTQERKLLEPMLAHADLYIETSQMHLHQLREIVRERVEAQTSSHMSLLFESFGYKRGIPADADFVFDVRCLPNPHWESQLRPLTGLDPEVARFLEGQPAVLQMFEHIRDFLEAWIPRFEADNRSYMTVALGCTGGQHRSVYLVQLLAGHFRAVRENVIVRHRELP
ncbi:MAG TPA: RNase adapter RapZ, partial [Gammaproteobacteria bacterium]|nr:RNase adapter RapZ [Gammaproteobacteria bacterium]